MKKSKAIQFDCVLVNHTGTLNTVIDGFLWMGTQIISAVFFDIQDGLDRPFLIRSFNPIQPTARFVDKCLISAK